MLDGDYSQYGDVSCTKINLREHQETVHGSALSHDAQFIAFTFANGCVKVFDTQDMKQQQRALLGVPFDGLPSTGISWAPAHVAGEDQLYRLANVNSQGALFSWLWGGPGSSSDTLERQLRVVEEKNESAVCEFSLDGKQLFTAGSDRNIRVYDMENLKAEPTILNRGVDDDGGIRPAHSNRIFSLKFLSPTTFISAGWQSPIQVWDLRTARAERQINGANPASNGLEAMPGTTRFFCCSAQRPSQQIQVFDYVQCREIVEESEKFSASCERALITSVSYRPEIETLWAASSKPDQVLQLCTRTGATKAVIPVNTQLMSLTSSPADPTRVYASGAKEACYVIEQME